MHGTTSVTPHAAHVPSGASPKTGKREFAGLAFGLWVLGAVWIAWKELGGATVDAALTMWLTAAPMVGVWVAGAFSSDWIVKQFRARPPARPHPRRYHEPPFPEEEG